MSTQSQRFASSRAVSRVSPSIPQSSMIIRPLSVPFSLSQTRALSVSSSLGSAPDTASLISRAVLRPQRTGSSSVPFSDQRNTTTSPAATAQSSIFQNTPSPPMPQSMGRRALLCQLKIEVKP